MIVRCKPTYNFQVVEFEYEVNNDKDLDEMFEWYGKMIQKMIYVSPDQPDQLKNKGGKYTDYSYKANVKTVEKEDLPKVEDEPASPNQIKYLVQLGISREDAKTMTKKQAWTKIQELREGK